MKLAPIILAALFAACAACGHRHAPADVGADPADAGRDGGGPKDAGADAGPFVTCSPWKTFPDAGPGPQGEYLVSNSSDAIMAAGEGDYVAYRAWSSNRLFLHRLSTGEESEVKVTNDFGGGATISNIDSGRLVIRYASCAAGIDCVAFALFDLATCTGKPFDLPPAFRDGPFLQGHRVVWDIQRGTIDGFDLSTWTEAPLFLGKSFQEEPLLDGDLLVWTDRSAPPVSSIVYLRLSDGTVTHLPATASQYGASASGGRIVWTDERDAYIDANGVLRGMHIYMLTVATGEVKRISPATSDQDEASIDGHLVAYADDRNGSMYSHGFINSDVYVLDLDTGIETPLVTAPENQGHPRIFDNGTIWLDHRGGGTPRLYWNPNVKP